MLYQLDNSIDKFIDRAKQYSNKGIECPIDRKFNVGAVGKVIENNIIEYTHRDNKSDMPKLELKTKNINSNNTISLAKYTDYNNAFNRTFNKVKDNLALIFYYIKNDKIYFDKMSLFTKLNKSLFATYLSPVIRGEQINYTIGVANLEKVYNECRVYEYE